MHGVISLLGAMSYDNYCCCLPGLVHLLLFSLSFIVSFQGKSYCIWKLSDLLDCDKTVSFFLFGNVYKEHWKNHLGTVIGLLNPSMMDKAERVFFLLYAPTFLLHFH